MRTQTIQQRVARCALWPERFPPEQWSLYKKVILEAQNRGLRFAVGGGLAAMAYAGQWRNTKDIDLYILPRERDDMIRVVTDLGLGDYYEKQSYDRKWIYRSYREDTIVDLIWAMANQRAVVDENWLEGPEVEVDGERFRLIAPEEALWSKVYVMQRERCDWPDALNLLFGTGPELDWRRVLDRIEDDAPLLRGLLTVFGWVCPDGARELPSWVWDELQVCRPEEDDGETTARRAPLLDSRPWFTPTLENDDKELKGC